MVPGKLQSMCTHFALRVRARCGARGFTLVELMITLAVAAILTVIAVPSFKHVLISTNLASINNDLVGDLQYARTEAVSRQVDVAVAQSGGSWQNGWTVEIPPATTSGGATATVLRSHTAVSSRYVVDAGATTSVTYQPQGLPNAAVCFTISAPDASGNEPRYLQVLPAGMVQQTTGGTTPTNPDCAAPASP